MSTIYLRDIEKAKALKSAVSEMEDAVSILKKVQSNMQKTVLVPCGDRWSVFSLDCSMPAEKILSELTGLESKLSKLLTIAKNGFETLRDTDESFKWKLRERGWFSHKNGFSIGSPSGVLWGLFGKKQCSNKVNRTEEKHVDISNDSKDDPDVSNDPDVIVNDSPNYPTNRGLPVTPEKTNYETKRSPEAYSEVIDSFDVENRARYMQDPNGDTWCNVYAADVTKAMGCEIPHYYSPDTGTPLEYYEPGGIYTSAAGMRDWLYNYGSSYGWIECDAETAISMANQGHPSVVLDTAGEHIAIVAPQEAGEEGVQISQAGWKNFRHTSVSWGWSSDYTLKYYYHE